MLFSFFAFRSLKLYLVHLDLMFADLEPIWGHPGPSWPDLELILGDLGPILGPSWAYLGPLLGHLGPSWPRKSLRSRIFELILRILSHLPLIYRRSSPIVAPLDRNLGHLGPNLGLLWPNLGLPMGL